MAQQIFKLGEQHEQAVFAITVDQQDIIDAVSALKGIKGGANRAIRLSVNKSLTGVRTDMVDETTKVLNVKKKTVRETIFLKRASAGNMNAYARSKGKPLNLYRYGARQTKKGVTVKILKGEGRRLVKHAFIATLPQSKNNIPGVYWRQKVEFVGTKPKTRTDKAYAAMPFMYRFPIEALTGPRIQDIMGRPGIIKKIEEQAGQRMLTELDHQVQRILSKHKG